jgi:hypothetical protein
VESKIHLERSDITGVEESGRLGTDSSHEDGGTVVQRVGEDRHVPFRVSRFVGDEADSAVFDKFDAGVANFVDKEIASLSEMLIDRFAVATCYRYSVRHQLNVW